MKHILSTFTILSCVTISAVPPRCIQTTIWDHPVSFLTQEEATEIQTNPIRSAQALHLINIFKQRILKPDDHRIDFEFLKNNQSVVALAVTIMTLTQHEDSIGCGFPKEQWDVQRDSARNIWDDFCKLLKTKQYSDDILDHLNSND